MAKKIVEEVEIEKPIDGYYVLMPFKDKKKHGDRSYSIGEDVSHLDNERLKYAIELGLVEFVENKV